MDDTRLRADRPLGAKRNKPERSRGQILILFVMAIFVFVGMVALVIDVSWYWVNSLRVQRAADAAALAGVVQLPTNPNGAGGAFGLALAEAKRNGYDDADAAISVSTVQDPPVTGRRLVVTVSAPIDMFFMRIFGLNSIVATRTSKAEFVLPVPMGSPENWYGVFGKVRGLTSTTTTTVPAYTTTAPGNSGFDPATTAPAPTTPVWTRTPTAGQTLITAVNAEDTNYVQTSVTASVQEWGSFNLLSSLAADETAMAVKGIQVELTDVHVSAACASTTIRVSLSYDNGVHWTTNIAAQLTPALGTSTTTGDYTLGSATSLSAWPLASPAHTWIGNDLGNSNFRLRLTANKGCATAGIQMRVDRIRVRADYDVDTLHPAVTTTTTTTLPDADLKGPGTACSGVAACYKPDGPTLTPRGFWGTMNTQGAQNINGDAYQPYYNTNGGILNPDYDADAFYNYAVEMPAGSTGGSVYVYDPVFCATAANKGTGDRWFAGAGDGVSSFYELYDTQGTLYDSSDDGSPVASSSGLFRNISASDTTMGGSSGSECYYSTNGVYGDGRDFHSNWYRLATGLAGGTNGKVYRVHTTSTDPLDATAQLGVDGENSFALYVGASGGTPRIYGIGAMQAFTPLSASGSPVSSEFYLAQIDAVHAGKTVEIKLWDPGDTNPLSASLQILVPTAGGWAATNFDWTAAKGTTNGQACTTTGTNVSSVQTNVGNTTGTFNGCWLTIQIPIPGTYTAQQSGWWKIRYTMNGTGTSNDVTTWKVEIRGNPVHLIVP
jgi:Flp pilus assembly protein TadG